jgi:hypothetical protein
MAAAVEREVSNYYYLFSSFFSFGQRTPTATSIHQYNLADDQREVTEPPLLGVRAADLLSDGGPCEGFRDTLEDDRA